MSEKRTFVVTVPESEMINLEKAWYEYNGSKDIAAHCMSHADVQWDVLQEYLDMSELKFAKCEMEKAKLARAYKPEEVDLTKFNQNFDFAESTITFTEA